MLNHKYIRLFLLINNFFFLLLYFTLCYHNRFAADDFHFIGNVNHFGVLKGTVIEYNTWSTRWSSVLLNHSVIRLSDYTNHALFFFGTAEMILFIVSIIILIENISRMFYKSVKTSLWQKFNISVFIISAIFYCTIKTDETWFWLCASCTYLMSVIMLIWGMAWLSYNKKNIFLLITGCIAFTHIGSSNEPMALITLLFLLIFFIAIYLSYIKSDIPKKLFIKRVIIASLFCITAFVILYMGEGNRVREGFFRKITIAEAFIMNIKFTGIIFLRRIPHVLPYVFLFSLPSGYLGQQLYQKTDRSKWLKNIIIISIVYLFTIYFYQLPITYKTQDIGAYRSLFPVSVYTLIYMSALFFVTGKFIRISEKLVKSILIIAFTICSFVNIYNYIIQSRTVKKYSEAYDKRIEYLIKNRENNGVLYLTPLPPSGMLLSGEISSDTSFYENQHLKDGLNLKCNVAVKEY